ncbi:phage Gp37/Gp68 family protein [Sphingobium sp. RAC03]|uniref:phage Gp37/Gp68 family protein n=1 Tax=Sphingobium sp. RAC03 TaxID=1843368 RepID=UPI00083D8274|nr:phage Gp37/Gp68 family protein [Sphingobium sp. RAC03]AOF96843.1 phage Gp37/Gp68 family protein [Sphingobium sp. RAC03]
MAENTKIEWAHHTFNGWIGCTKVGPGCDNCYAADLAQARLGVPWGAGQPRRHTAASTWEQPRRWNRRAAKERVRYRVFCSSLADVFDNEVPVQWRSELFQLIRETPHLDWLLVTKRIGNAAKMAEAAGGLPENVWLGITVVNQVEAKRDIAKLLAVNAEVRFLSVEPMLGPIDLTEVSDDSTALDPECWGDCACDNLYGRDAGCRRNGGDGRLKRKIDWVICGGESGPRARPMHPDWARSLRDQCANAGVPFLFKQWGEWESSLDRERDDPDWRANYTNDYVDDQRPGGRSRWLNLAGGSGFHGERFHVMRKVGKKAAGRLLDGVQHDGVPL